MVELQRIIQGLLSNPISQAFCLVIIAYFIIAAVCLMAGGRNIRAKAVVDNAPGILTSLGILGTFTGIFVGLLDFDIRSINRSVPVLLEGLKVAFGSSILGLATAALFRILRPVLVRSSVPEDASGRDILESLQAISTNLDTSIRTSRDGFEKLRTVLTDGNGDTVSNQLQAMQSGLAAIQEDINTGFNLQITEFHKFSEHVSRVFSETIIEELKSTIREFNDKMSEQFGDNFRQLNEAVGRLVVWQENYRQQLEELKQVFDQSIAGIQVAQHAVSDIEKSAGSIPEHMEKLSQVNASLQKQLAELHAGLSSLSEMRTRAEEAVPVVSEKIDAMTQTLGKAADMQKESMQSVTEAVGSVTRELDDTVKSINTAISTSLSEQSESHSRMIDSLQTTLAETLRNATNQMNEAIVQLDEAMQREIERVIRTMAENLSGMTQRLVEDYTPLLEQSRKIVELSQEASRQ